MPHDRRSLPRLSIAAALLSLSAAVHAAPVSVDMPAQPLAASIQQLSHLSGVSIGGDASLLAGRTAPAVRGTMEPIAALNRLLAGSGLEAQAAGAGSLLVVPAQGAGTELPLVVVSAAREADGSAAAGYRVGTVKNVGPWGEHGMQETPYSINVISSDLIDNQIAVDNTQIFQMAPNVQPGAPASVDGAGASAPFIRGFTANAAIDGLPITTGAIPLADVERVEILNGVSTFLNDSPSLGGVVNYVMKRPTAEPLAKVTLGNYGGEQYYTQVDLGGPIAGDKRLDYRLNVAHVEGDTAKKGQHLKRTLYSGAIDWHLTNDVLLQFNASRNEYRQKGMSVYWNNRYHYGYHSIPDPHRSFSQPWIKSSSVIEKYGANLTWNINDNFTMRAMYQYKDVESGTNGMVRNGVTSMESGGAAGGLDGENLVVAARLAPVQPGHRQCFFPRRGN
jgi:iron complex outermembrane receptor protein